MSKGITRNAWIVLKQAWNISSSNPNYRSLECGNASFENYTDTLIRYFGFNRAHIEQIGVYCLISKHNAEETNAGGFDGNPFEELGPEEVLVPNIYSYDIEFIDDEYDFDNYYDECRSNGISGRYEIECDCLSAMKEGYDKDGEYYEEDCTDHFGTDEECECTEFEEPVVELYRWNYSSGTYYSTHDDFEIEERLTQIDDIRDNDIITLYEDGQGEYTDWETWDYFDSDREGEVLDWQMEDVGYEIERTVK